MRKYLFICFVLMLFVSGCTKKEADIRRIVVDVKEIQKSVPVSRFVDSLKYIPLETTEASLFKQIDKLCMDKEGNFYILDREGVKAIYKFDKQGRFQGQIGYWGKGPREYLEITDFCLYGDTIVEIYDSSREKRMQYATSGNFIQEENNWDMGGAAFIHVGDTVAFYASCGGYAPNLNVYINGKEYGFFKQDYPEMRDKSEYFHTDGSRLYYSDNYNDTLYCFRDGKMVPYFYVDFGEYKLPKGIRDISKAREGDFCYNIDELKFTSRYTCFNFENAALCIEVFWDKEQNTVELVRSFDNDIDGVPFLIRGRVSSCPDKIITYLGAGSILRNYNNCRKLGEEISVMYEDLVKQVTEDSNPVIVLAYMKK